MSDLDTSPLRITVDADAAELSKLRRQIGARARHTGASEDVAEDLELAVSELATNVIRHTDARHLTVAFARSADRWMLDVSDADDLADLGFDLPCDVNELSGRGLAIVGAVMDGVELIDVDGHQHIRCFKSAI